MFSDNLVQLRKLHSLSQEDLAEKLSVSRQTVSKWESGESLPDIEKCRVLADLFEVSLDDLVSYEPESDGGYGVPPRGKHIFGVVTVGEKGQIVLPAKARKVFSIEAGERLLVLGDEGQGLAIMKERDILRNLVEPFHRPST